MILQDIKTMDIPKEVLQKVPSRVALHYGVMPIYLKDNVLGLCAPEGFGATLRDELKVILNRTIEFHPAKKEDILEAIQSRYGVADEMIAKLAVKESGPEVSFESIEDLGDEKDASIRALVNELITDALKQRATDIHLEPFEDKFMIRYRVDGILREPNITGKIRPLSQRIVSRIKIMANLDIGEKRLPQDGRIKVRTGSGELDLRVSVLPSSCGEAVVIRILGSVDLLNLDLLGFSRDTISLVREALKKPHGIILLTGPTGSGKTTTLYSILKEMNAIERKIITIEDPIEYKMSGVLQMQVKPQIEFTFSSALRSMLRHDPDVLMVGEIRDQETAEIAIRSALTGHLVFSTLHTNDAPSALTRLLEMGIAPYLVASAVELVIAQRLVRVLCVNCKQKVGSEFIPAGCVKCSGSGFQGREAIEEALKMDDPIRQLVLRNASSHEIKEYLMNQKFRSLMDQGRQKVVQGITAAGEIVRVC